MISDNDIFLTIKKTNNNTSIYTLILMCEHSAAAAAAYAHVRTHAMRRNDPTLKCCNWNSKVKFKQFSVEYGQMIKLAWQIDQNHWL